ncbi:MAG TPA: sugar transferase [Pirellulales bacterium]|jgi:lipopolysaccharide/colanic/teichoic acid biosynthesis glycosyltransferase|nr:sugar transferase [Pirellulales bacterium]
MLKRTFDLLASLVGLAILAPFGLLVALAVKLDSRGAVFFRQVRVGRDFRPFKIYKFRTMVADAPARGGQLTAGADPRITRVGRILRKTKIDELPQLINVLIGDMSLVGPRPEVPKYVELFASDYRDILSVRPGITDPASVKYRDEAKVLAAAADPEVAYVEQILPEKIALSRQYIARSSLIYDVAILWQTLWHIVR